MYFGCSKEPSHRDGSVEYPQHMFWLRNKKNNFQLRIIWRPDTVCNSVALALVWEYQWSLVLKAPAKMHLKMFFACRLLHVLAKIID